MELYFRTALCVILFIGYLEANPIHTRSTPDFEMSDLMLDWLEETACGGEKFTTPSNVTDKCKVTALKIFRKEMQRVRDAKKCDDKGGYIFLTLGTLEKIFKQPEPSPSPDCQMEPQPLKPFGDFRKAFTDLMKQFNSA